MPLNVWQLLSTLCTVTCSQILGLIMDSTKHQGSMKGQEERDILFARLFGISSVIQSGLAVRSKPLPSSPSSETAASSMECFEQIISSLLSLGDQKSWLRESAWFAIDLAVEALRGSDVAWKEEAVEKTLDALFTTHSVWSTEKLALTLKLQNNFPSRDWKRYLSPTFKKTNVLSTGNLATVAKILKVGQSLSLPSRIHFAAGIGDRRRRSQRSNYGTKWGLEASTEFFLGHNFGPAVTWAELSK